MFGVKVNFLWHIIGQAIIIRKKPLPRLTAFFYTLFAGLFYYIKYKNLVRSSFTNKIIWYQKLALLFFFDVVIFCPRVV